jgi:hypothetical protein
VAVAIVVAAVAVAMIKRKRRVVGTFLTQPCPQTRGTACSARASAAAPPTMATARRRFEPHPSNCSLRPNDLQGENSTLCVSFPSLS